MKEKEFLEGILGEYFTGYKYLTAIDKIKNRIKEDNTFKEDFILASSVIKKKELSLDEAFNMVAYRANLPLDEDTGEEAYKWLNLLIQNVESNNEIIEY